MNRHHIPGGPVPAVPAPHSFAARYRRIILEDCTLEETAYKKNRRGLLWTFRLVFAAILGLGLLAFYHTLRPALSAVMALNRFQQQTPDSTLGRMVENYNIVVLFLALLALLFWLLSLRLYICDLMQRNRLIRELLRRNSGDAADQGSD